MYLFRFQGVQTFQGDYSCEYCSAKYDQGELEKCAKEPGPYGVTVGGRLAGSPPPL